MMKMPNDVKVGDVIDFRYSRGTNPGAIRTKVKIIGKDKHLLKALLPPYLSTSDCYRNYNTNGMSHILKVGSFNPEARQISMSEAKDIIVDKIDASEASGESIAELIVQSLGDRQTLAHLQSILKDEDVTFNDSTYEFEVHPEKHGKFVESLGGANVVMKNTKRDTFVIEPTKQDGEARVLITGGPEIIDKSVKTPEELCELLENFLS